MKDTFAQRVQIRSVTALQRATALILAYRSQQKAVENELERELQQVRERFAERFQCKVGTKTAKTMPISERIEQLESAVEKFTTGSREKVFSAGTKTAKFEAAVVQIRDYSGRIDFLPGCNRRTSAMAFVAKATGFQVALAKLLKKFGLDGRVMPSWDLDWDGLKKAIRNEEIDEQELESVGMYWDEPTTVHVREK